MKLLGAFSVSDSCYLLFLFLLFIFIVYNVAGLCSYDLFDEINFEEWFSQGLVKELQNKSLK
jgi:hypothetical protein